ncbi:hypothetical protein E8E13_003914 [Curvularia kusanoi]|uniref:Phenylalanine ammonia-lyase n=1 Tax=Curvularia kusanoi TaxID=90978 RepID=A0A9P4W2S0_CURKU|nr:hypothetical protein E8E13_003914 [Curvularia kusanoi]
MKEIPHFANHTDIVCEEWASLKALLTDAEPKPVLTGKDLNIAQIISVARHHVQTSISPTAVDAMLRSAQLLQQKLEHGETIYGVNTGFGGSADVRTKNVVDLQRALIREFHYGILPQATRDHVPSAMNEKPKQHSHDLSLEGNIGQSYLPWSWARAGILIRINSLINGCSAIRSVIAERMQDLLNHDLIPMIPLRGSISASGDLSPLSYICGAIQGKSTIRLLSRGADLYADQALANAGLTPVELQAKEGLAVVNGTAISAAAAALILHDANGLALMAQILTAMSVEALMGTVESFLPFFSQVRPHPGQIESARNILAFLSGSQLVQVNDGAESSLRQDRYSIRTAPQWLGPILEDFVLAHQQVSIECNSATDNPLVDPSGTFLHGGNFQAKAVTSAMEKIRQGLQGIGRMLFSQCTEIINPATNRGLPPNLIAEDPSLSLIFKGTDIHIAALAAELGFLANPVNHVQTAEMGNQSLNSLALISARYTHTAIDVLTQLMAAHLVALCQALDLRALHVQFLDAYKAEFVGLVEEYCGGAELHDSGCDGAGPECFEVGIQLPADTPSVSVPELSNLSPPAAPKPQAASTIASLLWHQLLKAFDSTTSLDADARFLAIAKSLRQVLLDHPTFPTAPDCVQRMQGFTEALASSLRDAWCAHRDSYLVHGDATPLLGEASRTVYGFVRRTLGVPLLATRQLLTPRSEELECGSARHGGLAPTVGSYTGAVYRALRDGSLTEVAVGIVRASL